MEELIETNEPLNPYAKAFFGLWALIAFALVGFQSVDSSSKQSVEHQPIYRQAAQTSQPKQASLAPLNWLFQSN